MPAPSRHATAFVLATAFLDMLGYGIVMPVLPGLIEEVGQTGIAGAARIGGWMFFAFAMAQFLFAPLMGNLSDRYGRRPLLLLAVAGLGIDYLICLWAPTLGWLFAGRVFAGICGSSFVIVNACIADMSAPADRARAFGLMGAAYGGGFVLGPALGGLLGEFGPRVPFAAAAAIAAVNLAYGWRVLPETLPADRRRPFSWRRANPFGTFAVFRSYRGVLPLCLVLGLYMFASASYVAIWAFWGMAKFGWSEAMVGLTLAAFGIVVSLFQGLLTGPAAARFGEGRALTLGILCAVLAAAGYGLAPGLAAVLVLLVLHGPEGFIHPLLSAMMSRAVPEDAQGELQGGISAVMNVALLAGTVFFAEVFARFMEPGAAVVSPDVAWFVAAALLAGVLALWLAVRPQEVAA